MNTAGPGTTARPPTMRPNAVEANPLPTLISVLGLIFAVSIHSSSVSSLIPTIVQFNTFSADGRVLPLVSVILRFFVTDEPLGSDYSGKLRKIAQFPASATDIGTRCVLICTCQGPHSYQYCRNQFWDRAPNSWRARWGLLAWWSTVEDDFRTRYYFVFHISFVTPFLWKYSRKDTVSPHELIDHEYGLFVILQVSTWWCLSWPVMNRFRLQFRQTRYSYFFFPHYDGL